MIFIRRSLYRYVNLYKRKAFKLSTIMEAPKDIKIVDY